MEAIISQLFPTPFTRQFRRRMFRFLVLTAIVALGKLEPAIVCTWSFLVIDLNTLAASASPTPWSPLISGVNFVLDEEYYTIPTIDGGMQLMSRQQVLDHILLAPMPRFDTLNTIYNLHTRTNREGVRIYLEEDEALLAAGFNASNPIRFTMHGWNGDTTSTVNAVDQFLEAGDFNHIVVDWSAGAKTINYIDARNRVPEVARHVGLMAKYLVRMGSSWSQIYTIGHSLGGQMAALVGQYLEGDGEIAACICLDPAGPLFSESDANDRASPGDCKYVEVIHTNGGLLGFLNPIGDSDFYPNGGKSQPGCGIDLVGSCAHERAPVLFREALVTKIPFEGRQCNSSVTDVAKGVCEATGVISVMMSDPVNYDVQGLFYLTTSEASPFVVALE